MPLSPNDMAPDFNLTADDNQVYSLANFKGKNIVLYFYPKDNTPGCTSESKNFASLAEQFSQANTVILGLSKDSIASHQKFKTKFNLPFLLLSDPEGETCADYEAWGEKSMFGKKYMGIIRSTFIINTEGKIHQAWYKVKVSGHAKQVLKTITAM